MRVWRCKSVHSFCCSCVKLLTFDFVFFFGQAFSTSQPRPPSVILALRACFPKLPYGPCVRLSLASEPCVVCMGAGQMRKKVLCEEENPDSMMYVKKTSTFNRKNFGEGRKQHQNKQRALAKGLVLANNRLKMQRACQDRQHSDVSK